MTQLIHEYGISLTLVISAIFLMGYLTWRFEQENRQARKLIIHWIALLLLMVVGGLCIFTATENAKNKIRQRLSNLAQVFASGVQFMGHEDITSDTPQDDPHYRRIIAQLIDWQDRIDFVASIYTLRKNIYDDLVFMFDPAADLNQNGKIDSEIEKETRNGTVYAESGAYDELTEFISAFEGVEAVSVNVTHDTFGSWIAAAAPLRDRSGRVEAVLGIDFRADEWYREIQAARFWPHAFFLLSLLLFFSVQFYMLETQKKERALKESAIELKTLVDELTLAKHHADAASLAKSDFLANMSHEIRTPMTAILGYNEFLTASNVNDSQKQEATQVIRSNADLLLQIINDILDFSKMEAGRMDLEIRDIPLVPLLDELEILFSLQSREKNIELFITNSTSVPETIQTDSIRLTQVLMNIVGNAVKFTSEGGVYVTVSWRQDETNQGRNVLIIEIRDTGIGMSRNTLSGVFKPFQQADSSTTRHYGGTGLGLAIVNRLVVLLGGRIEVESTPGVGSCFRLFFPQATSPSVRMLHSLEEGRNPSSIQANSSGISQKRTTTSSIRSAFGESRPVESNLTTTNSLKTADVNTAGEINLLQGHRILLAEDGKDIQRLFSMILRKAGATVDVADNGQQAYEQIMANRPEDPYDIVIMDMQMPVMDGYTAVKKLREAGYQKTIVALTAAVLKKDIDRCLAVGCNDYAFKPIGKERLLEFVLKSLLLSPAIPPS